MKSYNTPLIDPIEKEGGKDIYEEADVLTRQQVNQALLDMEKMHPLKSHAKFYHIVPAFACFKSCFKDKKNLKHSLKTVLLKEMKMKIPKSDSMCQSDPFLLLGYGINAYFDIMISLAMMCFMVTLFMTPVMAIYAGNTITGLSAEKMYALN